MILSPNAMNNDAVQSINTFGTDTFGTDAIAIVGATASGKTATSLELTSLLEAKGVGVEIISADSRQLFRYLTIGTAKPSTAELMRVRHHCIDCRNPDEVCSAGEFGTEAAQILAEIRSRGNLPVIVGGSGLYVQALTDGMFDEDAAVQESEEYQATIAQLRSRLQSRFESEGIEGLYKELQECDPVSAHKYAERNPRRIIRALEYFHATGTPLSTAHQTSHIGRDFSIMFFGVEVEREELYGRINARAEQMFREGIVEETSQVLALGYAPDCNALNTVGYKECLALLRGEITQERALELTAQNTRRYAKRQMTWFRRNERISWCSGSPNSIAQTIIARLAMKNG